MKTLIIIFAVLALFNSCNDLLPKRPSEKSLNLKPENLIEKKVRIIPQHLKPVFGYRFIIKGDFNGDGKKESLVEHFFSGLDNKETNKFYDSLSDYSELVTLTEHKEPYSFILSDNKLVDTLHISSNKQLLGLSYFRNEGDLNGEGTDEVSYVVNWADWSNVNTWHLVTYKQKKWIELYSFPIWDWQLPDLPNTFNEYGFMGLENTITTTTNATVNNHRAEDEMMKFRGLIKKIKTNTIQVIFRNDELVVDTMLVELKEKN